MKKQYFGILVALALMMPAATMAESGMSTAETAVQGTAEAGSDAVMIEEQGRFRFHDLTLSIGQTSYSFPMSLEECREAGINIPELKALRSGEYYPNVPVDNGRTAFDLRVEALANGTLVATGFTVKADDAKGAEAAGIIIGETRRDEIEEDTEERPDLDYIYSGSDNMTVEAFEKNYYWSITFEGEDKAAAVERVMVRTSIPGTFGMEFENLHKGELGLPDVMAMSLDSFILDGTFYTGTFTMKDLLERGWVPEQDRVQETYSGRSGSKVWGYSGYLYNGSSLVHVEAYNLGVNQATLEDCVVTAVGVTALYGGTSLVTADGWGLGDSRADFETVLGEAVSDREGDHGTVICTYRVLNNVTYKLAVLADQVVGVEISGLQ